VRFIGRSISVCENGLRRFCSTQAAERRAGVLLVAVIVLSVYGAAAFLTDMLRGFSDSRAMALGYVVLVYLAATTIAGVGN